MARAKVSEVPLLRRLEPEREYIWEMCCCIVRFGLLENLVTDRTSTFKEQAAAHVKSPESPL